MTPVNWDTFIANPGGQGFTEQTFLNVPVGVDELFSNGASGRYLIIGARNETDMCGTSARDGGDDTFKIQQIVADTPRVPEPGTLLLFVSGLGGLGLRAADARRPERPAITRSPPSR